MQMNSPITGNLLTIIGDEMTDNIEMLNNKVPIWKHAVKPCKIMEFCPYGSLVEMFPLQTPRNKMSCSEFGHDCPVFYQAEIFIDFPLATEKEKERWFTELNIGTFGKDKE
jgi:hypothetical protein